MLGSSYDKAAVRRTRQDLASNVRNDWGAVLARARKDYRRDFDGAKAHISTSFGNESDEDLTRPPSSPRKWRERTYASSDPSSSELSEDDTPTIYSANSSNRPKSSANDDLHSGRRAYLGHHCMFPDGSDGDAGSSTDSSGLKRSVDADAIKKQARKRRRRRRLEQEMIWNEGLRNWEQTRDIWCRAKRVPLPDQVQAQNEQKETQPMQEGIDSSESATNSTATSVNEDVQANKAELKPFSQRSIPSPNQFSPSNHADRQPPSNPSSASKQAMALLPLAHPLIPPSDPGRQNIKSQYSLIYAKVVTEGLRPQVPINLSHMIPALVKGWKANNEWPPKGTPAAVRDGEVKGLKTQKGPRQRLANTDSKGTQMTSSKSQRTNNRRPSGAGAAFEGLKEGSRRLFGITNSSSPKSEAQKDEGARSPKSPKSGTFTQSPGTQTTSTFHDANGRRKPERLTIATSGKSTETPDTANGASLYEREILGSRGHEPGTPPQGSPRGSVESAEKEEKKSPLDMRKNVKMVGRRIRNSLGGTSGSGGSSG